MRHNPLLNADSYKYSHYLQIPKGTEYIFSYIESRGGIFPQTVFFGLQMFIKEYLLEPFTQEDINEADKLITAHGLPFNREGFEYILKEHGGIFPVRINAVPEGTVVPTNNMLLSIVNEDPKVPWVTSFLETALLRAIWYPTTVATLSYNIRKVIAEAMEISSDTPDNWAFKLNDFGSRGATSAEAAMIGGLGHLVIFSGTDNDLALAGARRYYNATGPVGFSIPAAEHSTMTSWGGPSGELNAMTNMVDQFVKPGTMAACVSDSYDIWNAVENYWGDELHEKVKNSGGTLVVRPDSGDPLVVPVEVVKRLMDKVGYTVNSKGYKVLPPYFRVIQGDGINLESIKGIISNMLENGLSMDNLAFGMGGALLQGVNRDDLRFAMKTSAMMINGKWRDVFKDPITDPGKTSKKGLLRLIKGPDGFKTKSLDGPWEDFYYDATNLVYAGGKLLLIDNFNNIRERAKD